MKTVIVVHGGAWSIPDALAESSVAGVKAAARAGDAVLRTGRSAIDAVETAVRCLEDDPTFDAGHGSVLNISGEVELDSIIMDGETLAAGAVASVRNIANPVSLARAVMEKTDHVMLTDRGASMFAEHIGTPVAHDLVTELERKEWEHSKSYPDGVKKFFNTQWGHDTVGAVALDSSGNVACATSTGGIRNKMVGRVGDSPIIGSGGYADNRSGAVSCTGHGESILKVTLARLILFHVEQGKSAVGAAEASLQYMSQRVKGCGGAVLLSSTGDWTASFTTPRMAWASVKEDILHYGLNPKEHFTEMLK
ncbi:isoaspartyl peptidase/L-asparaginase isoform X2 [Danio rerio]|nr:isoaspartyl peptidase/L-asparaginase isoform X2 [Danio rerio]|eukprot:XP_699140.4 isoaspartyl peptidase/L-asparaginase isoform X2 [Danio rerio]